MRLGIIVGSYRGIQSSDFVPRCTESAEEWRSYQIFRFGNPASTSIIPCSVSPFFTSSEAETSHVGIHCDSGGQQCILGDFVWVKDGSCLVLCCLICQLLGKQTACGARFIRVLPTWHDGEDCPYDDSKYPNSLVLRQDDPTFINWLEANSSHFSEFDPDRIRLLKHIAYDGKEGFQTARWNWTASVSDPSFHFVTADLRLP